MKRRLFLPLALLGLIACPQHASANAGTPLMWAGMIHLVIGNALIGLMEGLLLGWLFRLPRLKAIGAMIVANYASAWLGGLFIRGAVVAALPMDLTNGWMWFWVMVVMTFCLTLLLEWPFVAWFFRGARDWLRRSLRASLVVQGISYLFLFGWYWLASGTSLYTRMHTAPPTDLALPEATLVYFIDPADGNVYRRELAGGGLQKICELHSTDDNDRLFVRSSATDSNRWDLMARLETLDHHHPRFVEVLTNMPFEAAPDWRSTYTEPPDYPGTWSNFGEVQALGSATKSRWQFWAGFWLIEGLRATHKATGERVSFSYETPFGAWTVRNAVHLPKDIALFQLGNDQICAFDPVSRCVALLWHGRGPVPVIAKVSAEPDDAAHASQPIRSDTHQLSALVVSDR